MGIAMLGAYRALLAERDGKRHTQARLRRINRQITNLEFDLKRAGLL